jgi:hypothetical protein
MFVLTPLSSRRVVPPSVIFHCAKTGGMTMSRNWTVGIVLCVVLSVPCLSRAADPTPEQLAAAVELLQTMHMDTMFSTSINQMLDMQLKQNPQIEKFRPIMLDFFKKYMSWDAMKDDMAKIYAAEFTTDELKE